MQTTKDTDLAWAAGFFDGEGHIRGKTKSKGELQVSQKIVTCLQRLQKIFNCGTIGGPYHAKNPVYFWYVTKTADVDRIMNSIWPYLSEPKRLQATNSGFIPGVVRNPKTGRPRKDTKHRPTCHPDKRHIGLGLCERCYHRERYRKLNNINPTDWRVK